MRLMPVLPVLVLAVPLLLADDRNIDFDAEANFSAYKTFTIREGQLAVQKAELSGPLVRKKIEDSIRTQLTGKGLKEAESQADLVVTFRLGAADRRQVESFPVG